jgi:adenylyltransferase/sulfurtransferase
LTNRDYELVNLRRSCGLLARENLVQGKVPTTPTAAAILGGIQTQEVLKLIHGLEVQPGVSIIFNGLTNDCYTTRLPVKADCLSHASLDEIIEVPDAQAMTTTPTDLLTIARQHLGPSARLFLGFDLATALRCRRCGTEADILKPLHKLTEREARCPICGEQRVPEVISEFRGDETLANRPLCSLGVPPLAILTAYDGAKALGLELTGDICSFLNFC